MGLGEYNSTDQYWLRYNTTIDDYQMGSIGYNTADGFENAPGIILWMFTRNFF